MFKALKINSLLAAIVLNPFRGLKSEQKRLMIWLCQRGMLLFALNTVGLPCY